MSPLASLLSTDVLLALAAVFAAGLLEPLLAYRLNRALAGNHVFHWAWDHLGAPLIRAALVAAFVLIAYPALFGAHSAPPLSKLIADGSMRLSSLLNVLFISSLVLPALPPLSSRQALVIPVQGLIAVAMVFGWYTDYLGASSASFWPGFGAAGATVAMAIVAHLLAKDLGAYLGVAADRHFNTSGFDRLVPNAVELVVQMPVMLYYGLILGRQISI